MIELSEIKNMFLKDGVFLSFNGFLSQDVLVSLGNVIEAHFSTNKKEERIFLSIFSVLTEQMQNVIKYSNGVNSEKGGIAVIGFSEYKKKYFVATGNYIDFKDREVVKNKIDSINSLSKIEIRKLYRERRKSGLNKHEKGAGLGFLEIAKQCTEPLQYKIDKVENNNMYFFQLFSYI
jgi:hypothetical protein